jgi:hypothetical protein
MLKVLHHLRHNRHLALHRIELLQKLTDTDQAIFVLTHRFAPLLWR